MKKGLQVKNDQIISNELVEIRSEFKLMSKLLKAASAFTGNMINHIIIGNNAVYLCWGSVNENMSEKLKEKGFTYIQYDSKTNTFKELALEITQIVKNSLSSESNDLTDEKDHYDEYAEHCYLGCRLTTDFHDDKHMNYNQYYYAFARITPSWITLEK